MSLILSLQVLRQRLRPTLRVQCDIGQARLGDFEVASLVGKTLGIHLDIHRLHVRTNADTPRDAKKARELGARGRAFARQVPRCEAMGEKPHADPD